MHKRIGQPPVISLKGVALELAGKTVLRDIEWEVREGESWAVIGPNGSGKTSLIGIVNGYRWPTRGEVEILGMRFGEKDLRDLRSMVGMVSSYLDEYVEPRERVLDLVVSGRDGSMRMRRSASPPDLRRATSLLRSLGCPEGAERTIGELSQGERQKAMIARAMMSEPRLLTLDEPCEGLDLSSREVFLNALSGLSKQGKVTLVDVTHRTDEIPEGFTHALLLREGTVLGSGPVGEVLSGATVSECFGVRVRLKKVGGRFYTVVL